jgi:hypothetical protein
MEEHQEVPKEDAAVMPVVGPKNQCRVKNLAADSRQKRKDGTRRIHESRRKLAASCRKVSHCAAVAWRKRNIFRKIRTKENCGLHKELTVAGRRMTRRARVAWCRENFVRKEWTKNQAEQGTPKPRKDGKRLWKGQEFNDGLREGLRKQPRSEIGTKDPDTRRQLRLRIKRTSDRIDRKTFRLETLKRANKMSSRLEKVRKWTLWRDRPPPKRHPPSPQKGGGTAGRAGTSHAESPAPTVAERERGIFE